MKKTAEKILLFFILISCLLLPQAVLAEEIDPYSLTAKGAILMEVSTGKVMFEKDADLHLPMASITKLMVLLIADEKIEKGELSLTDIVTGSPNAKAVGGSTIYLEVGETMTVEDILKGISLNSANDGAVALAETISGSEGEFVKLMNQKAQELGMTNTNYINTTGLDADNHYSSARDLAILARVVVKNHPRIMEHAKIWTDSLRGGRFELANTNKLLKRYQYTTGLKTGTTDNAGYCLLATADKDGMQMISVVLGASTDSGRYNETIKLFNYAYNNFEVAKVASKDDVQGQIKVIRGGVDIADAVVPEDLITIVPLTYSNKITTSITLQEEIKAPVPAGTVVGAMEIKAGDTVVETVDLVISQEIKKISLWQAFGKMFQAWFHFSF